MRVTRNTPTQVVLNEWFYEEPLGVLVWRKDHWIERNGRRLLVGRAGEVAGHEQEQRRVQITFQGKKYYRSRLIYKLHANKEPAILEYINKNHPR